MITVLPNDRAHRMFQLNQRSGLDVHCKCSGVNIQKPAQKPPIYKVPCIGKWRAIMTFKEVSKTVGADFELAMTLVKSIVSQLPGAEYENIRKRKSGTVPSVYLAYEGQRILSFDLRKRGGVKIYFWKPKRLTREIEDRFDIVPERSTGWKGFSLDGLNDPSFNEALMSITSYWSVASTAIAKGSESALWKREDLVKSLTKEAFPDETLVFNKQSIPRSNSKPDIFLPRAKVIIQVDGSQHFQVISIFHPTRKAFQRQITRDEQSNKLALEAGIFVLRIVADAANMITASSLKQYVSAVVECGGVMYLVRQGNSLLLTSEKPLE